MAEGGIKSVIPESNSDSGCDHEEIENKMDAIDMLLERTRSERINELRAIENENRPVTGQTHRDNIDQFIRKNMEVRENVTAAQATGKENVPLNTGNVGDHRPEAIIIEIQGLTQQQRVSNSLGTSAFRRHLENIIRGSIRTVTHNHSPTPPPAREQTPAPEATARVSVEPDSVPVPHSLVPTERRDSISSHSTNSASSHSTHSVSSSSTTSSSSVPVDYNTRIQDPRGLLGAVSNNGFIPPPPPPMLAQEIPVNIDWNVVEEMQNESLVQEVSELVHRQLVTSTLNGEFRNVLELHIRNRVDATGTDGERVQEFIQSIPQSEPHIRNDFSNILNDCKLVISLGIHF